MARAGALLKVGQAAVYTQALMTGPSDMLWWGIEPDPPPSHSLVPVNTSALTFSLMTSAAQVAAGTLTIGDIMLVDKDQRYHQLT